MKAFISYCLAVAMHFVSYSHSCNLYSLTKQVGVIYGSPEVTSGGNALKFYSSVRLDTRRKEILPDNSGIRIKVKVVKNKVSAPFKVIMLDVLFGTGIDGMGCTVDAANDLGILERKGSWYAYKGNNIAQGRQNVVDLLKKDTELAAIIETEVRLALSSFGKDVVKPEIDLIEDDEPVLETEEEIEIEEESYLE